jgi:hypothetical protein
MWAGDSATEAGQKDFGYGCSPVSLKIYEACLRKQAVSGTFALPIPRSSKGRTTDFGSVRGGSNPSRGTRGPTQYGIGPFFVIVLNQWG